LLRGTGKEGYGTATRNSSKRQLQNKERRSADSACAGVDRVTFEEVAGGLTLKERL